MDVLTASPSSSSDLYSTSESDDPPLVSPSSSQDPVNASGGLDTHSNHEDITFYSQNSARATIEGTTGHREGFHTHTNDDGTVNSGLHKRKREVGEDDRTSTPPGGNFNGRSIQEFSSSNGLTYKTPLRQDPTLEPGNKRSRLDELSSCFHQKGDLISGLPAQIWQTVFCFVPPVFLGRLLRVSHAFNSLLTPGATHSSSPKNLSGSRRVISAASIWAASRKRFCPGLPRPLRGMEELDMWRLLRGSHCQICGERKTLLTHNSSNPWNSGPGQQGVRVVWPFGIRCCGSCLRTHSEQEVALIFSSTFPAVLLPALPFAFVSQADNYVTSTTLRNSTKPTDVQLTKYYYKIHIEQIKQQMDKVKELGPASAEEWIKGLDIEGKEKSSDTARWEQWEEKGGLKKVNARPHSKPTVTRGKSTPLSTPTTKLSVSSNDSSGAPVNASNLISQEVMMNSASSQSHQAPTLPSTLRSATTVGHGSLPQRPQVPLPQIRVERNIRDVNEAKAARRAEIERRCMALDPPLRSNLLYHMESFQAALQISTALTDSAWEVLKPRLLAQREVAERRENERVEQSNLLQAKAEEKKHQDAQLKEAKELVDKEWDLVQTPIRDRLAIYADEIIQDKWAGGSSITKDTCSRFAAEVLLHASRRFREDFPQGDNAKQATGQDPGTASPNPLASQKLTLESMKWLFDNKVKGFTENFQKELFLCNGCDGNFKFYGFEGVIQHYAAKHTTSLSKGSVVVRWRAEWPERPPFHPNPSAAKAAYYAIPSPAQSLIPSHYRPPQVTAGFGEYGQVIAQPPPSDPQRFATHFSPSPFGSSYNGSFPNGPYRAPPLPGHYTGQPEYAAQSPAFLPANTYSQVTPDFSASANNVYGGHPDARGTATQQYIHPPGEHTFQSTAWQNGHVEEINPTYPSPGYMSLQAPNLPPKPTAPSIVALEPSQGVGAQAPDPYQVQLNEMAKAARDVWFGTSGIKDIPQSVRIYVVIHHVVTRFEEKYSNEPSVAMFIDGLDHNALMRPVRSLNGLACKTCVTGGIAPTMGFHAHPQHATSDRKLYTLPHLLNHFKSAHLERTRSTVDLQGGMESTRLDWKRDMIELPETPLIADLINAPGMDDAKLKLIAQVFPGVFPSPLPLMGSAKTTGPIPKYRGENKGTRQNRKHDVEVEATHPFPYKIDRPLAMEADTDYNGTESGSRPLSQSSVRTSETPREDEYDPHRPTYYGRIVESRQTIPSRLQATHFVATDRAYQPVDDGHGKKFTGKQEPKDRRHESGVGIPAEGYYMDNSSTHATDYGQVASRESKLDVGDFVVNDAKMVTPHRLGKEGTDRYVSEDGEVVEEPSLKSDHCNLAPVAETTAAERFLNNFNPDFDIMEPAREIDTRNTDNRARGLRSEVQDGSSSTYPKQIGRRLERPSGGLNDPKVQHRVGSTPPHPAWLETRTEENIRYAQLSDRQLTFHDDPRPTSGMHYAYSDAEQSADRPSPHVYSARSIPRSINSHEVPIERDPMEGRRELPRTLHSDEKWHQSVPSRSRSRSPLPLARERVPYRTRSPHESSRPEPVYRLHAPSIARDGQPQRLVQYAYPPAQDPPSHVANRRYPEDQYHRRVEYISLRPEEYEAQGTGRYVLAQPPEHRRAVDHVRVDRGYAGEELYERDGRLYYAEPRRFDVQSARAINPDYIDYRDDLR